MNLLKRAAAAAVTLLAVSVGTLVGPTPAYADTSCPNRAVCFWTHYDYTGSKVVHSFVGGYKFTGDDAFMNNNAQSAKNFTGADVLIYDSMVIGSNPWSYIGKGVSTPRLGSWVNRISSYAITD